MSTHCGTLEYASPELLTKCPQYGTEVDVWSLGCVLFVLTTSKMPFEAGEEKSLRQFVMEVRKGLCKQQFALIKKLSMDLQILLIRCFQVLAKDR